MTIQKKPPPVKNVLHAFYILTGFHNLGVELRVKDSVQNHVLHTVSDYVPLGYARQLRVTPVHQDANAIAVSDAHGVIECVAKFFDIIGQHSRCIHQPSRTDKEVQCAINERHPCSPVPGSRDGRPERILGDLLPRNVSLSNQESRSLSFMTAAQSSSPSPCVSAAEKSIRAASKRGTDSFHLWAMSVPRRRSL